MIAGFVRGQTLRLTVPRIVADTIDYLTAKFLFQSSDWDGLEKWAHFAKSGAAYDIRLTDDEITADAHLNLSAGKWTVYLHGNRYADGKVVQRVTTETQTLEVFPTGILDGEPFPTVPPSAGEQIIASAAAAEAGAKSAADTAGRAAESAKDSADLAAKSAEIVGDAEKIIQDALRDAKESGEFDGEDGITPDIGANGNWFVGATDTGVRAQGKDGAKGDPGDDYILTAEDKQEIAGLIPSGGNVGNVLILVGGTSLDSLRIEIVAPPAGVSVEAAYELIGRGLFDVAVQVYSDDGNDLIGVGLLRGMPVGDAVGAIGEFWAHGNVSLVNVVLDLAAMTAYAETMYTSSGGGGVVTITQDADGSYTCSHTPAEIAEMAQTGAVVAAVSFADNDSLILMPMIGVSYDIAVFSTTVFENGDISMVTFFVGDDAVVVHEEGNRVAPMTGASAADGGKPGTVPAPSAGQQDAVLHGDGTWRKVEGGGNADRVVLKSPDGTEWNITVSNDGVITATKTGGDGEDEEMVVFTPFKFIQVSDTHYQYTQDMTATFVSCVNALDDVSFVTASGDISLEGAASNVTDEEKEIELQDIKTNLIDRLDVPFYTCLGNHDYYENIASIWTKYTGMNRPHKLETHGCVFLFTDWMDGQWLDWLCAEVEANQGKRIFIYEHYPVENDDFSVGLKEGETRYTWSDTDMVKVLDILRNNRNIIWFTGHTHWRFGTAVHDVFNDNGLMSYIVHTPFLLSGQGWKISVGEDNTVLKAIEFTADGIAYLGTDYDYTIEQDVTDYGESKIVTEGETVTVGGETDISVYLESAPKNNQTVNVETNDIISADVTDLIFTPDNYNVPQTVKVSGISAGTGRLVLHSNSKTTVRKVDVVEGSATINYFNKNKPITLLGEYYGSGGSGSYQLSNMIPAETGDTVLSNALGSSTTYRLKMFDAQFNYIAEAQDGVKSINYTITEPNVKYVSVVYRGATVGQADAIMVTVNQELPSAYVSYNASPVGYVITNYADAEAPSVTNGYYDGSLDLSDKDGINVSNLIPCESGDVVYSNNYAKDGYTYYLYLYDATQAVIERISISKNGVNIQNANARYFAVCYDNSAENLMIMKNQKVPGYYVETTDTM